MVYAEKIGRGDFMIRCRLNVIFAERDIKKSQFAKRVGVNNGTLSDWCGNKSLPKLDLAYKVASELNMNVMEIWVEDGQNG